MDKETPPDKRGKSCMNVIFCVLGGLLVFVALLIAMVDIAVGCIFGVLGVLLIFAGAKIRFKKVDTTPQPIFTETPSFTVSISTSTNSTNEIISDDGMTGVYDNIITVIQKPDDITALPFDTLDVAHKRPPTERQLRRAAYSGIVVPEDACLADVNCMLNRIDSHYTYVDAEELANGIIRKTVMPDSSPCIELATYAADIGIRFSRFIGSHTLFKDIVKSASMRDRAAFYAYAVYLSLVDGEFKNLLEHPMCDRFYAFADDALKNPQISKSLSERDYHDFKKPHRGTLAYKAAIQYVQ